MTKAPLRRQDLQRRRDGQAKAAPSWRFWGLDVHVCTMETLREAYGMAKANNGAPGNELPRSKLRGIKTQNPSTSKQLSLHVLAMQLLLRFFTSLLLDILANDFFVAVTAYSTDAISFGPKFATPQALFDRRHAVKYLSDRQTFDHLDHCGRTRARDGLHTKMDMIFVCANRSKGDLIAFGDVQADVFAHRVDLRVKDDTSILGRTHDGGDQCRDIVPLMTIVAHKSDNTISEKAAASFEESDPQRLNTQKPRAW